MKGTTTQPKLTHYLRGEMYKGLTAGGGMILGMIVGIMFDRIVLGMIFGMLLGAAVAAARRRRSHSA